MDVLTTALSVPLMFYIYTIHFEVHTFNKRLLLCVSEVYLVSVVLLWVNENTCYCVHTVCIDVWSLQLLNKHLVHLIADLLI